MSFSVLDIDFKTIEVGWGVVMEKGGIKSKDLNVQTFFGRVTAVLSISYHWIENILSQTNQWEVINMDRLLFWIHEQVHWNILQNIKNKSSDQQYAYKDESYKPLLVCPTVPHHCEHSNHCRRQATKNKR